MNRIEQVATPAPAQQPSHGRSLPQGLTDVRRRAAQALLRRDFAPTRVRRGTTGLAVAIAALTIPVLPSSAFGATSPGKAPQARHHLGHDLVFPDPGAVTFQTWSSSGWSFRGPNRPADPDLPVPDHRYCVPCLPEPDGNHREISAYRITHTSPRLGDPDAPAESQTPGDASTDGTGPDSSTEPPPIGDASTDQPSDDYTNAWGARSRITPAPLIPTPLIPTPKPANTKQMLVTAKPRAAMPAKASAPLARAAKPAPARAGTSPSSPCLRAAYLAGKDRRMLAHLRPAAGAMNVVLTHPRSACAAMVDYLPQARA